MKALCARGYVGYEKLINHLTGNQAALSAVIVHINVQLSNLPVTVLLSVYDNTGMSLFFAIKQKAHLGLTN